MWWLRNSVILFGVCGEKKPRLRSHHHFLLGTPNDLSRWVKNGI